MEFAFEVNPDLDLAIGTELSFDESEVDYTCDFDFTDVEPMTPTGAKPGSEEKVRMLAARYAAGVSLWHDEDCYDHGPASAIAIDGDDSDHSDDLDDDDL